MGIFYQIAIILWAMFLYRSYKAITHLKSLDDFPEIKDSFPKSLSIVIAVKDDESEIEATIKKLLQSKLPDLEIIVVNDRSKDSTPQILDRLATLDPRLKIVHVHNLPKGWLGKVHALSKGTEVAAKDFILFMDADMGTDDKVLVKAMSIMFKEKLDHLSILPHIEQKSFFLDLLMSTSNILFTLSGRPWLSIEERPIHCVKGVGKFNLVRRTSFSESDGFEWLKMEVADDVALGQLMASEGGRSLFVKAGVHGPDLSWYPTFWEMVKGLEKNSVGGFTNYKWSMFLFMVSVSMVPMIVFVWAIIALQVSVISLLLGCSLLFAFFAKDVIKYPFLIVASFPLGIFILACVLVRSFLICQKNGGIKWSGTLYPLRDLKEGCRVRLGL